MNLPTGEEGKPKAKQTGGRASKKSTVSIIDNDEWIKIRKMMKYVPKLESYKTIEGSYQ